MASLQSGGALTFGAPPKSDVYASPRVPKVLFDYTAPVVFQRVPKASFLSMQVTVAAQWRTQFDQAGLMFTLPRTNNPNPNAANAGDAQTHPAWVKAGIEVNDGVPCVSIVARAPNSWSDWSLIPLSLCGVPLASVGPVTLQFTREKHALVVWLLRTRETDGDKERLFIRKVPWVFLDDESASLSSEAQVGVYAAQPDPFNVSGGKALQVTFSEFSIDVIEGTA